MTLFQGPPPAHLPALSAALTCLLTLGLDFLCLLSFALGSGEADRTSSLASSFLGAACSLLWVSPAESDQLDNVATGWLGFLRAVAAVALLVQE